MFKLTMPGPDARACYVNPRLVTNIMPRLVRDHGGAMGAMKVEGCHIEFGGPEDSMVAAMEPVEVVAQFVADHAGDSYMGLVDVVKVEAQRAEKATKAEKAKGTCPGPLCSGCDDPDCQSAIPF